MVDTIYQNYRSDLIIEIIAEKLQAKRLSDALPGSRIYPPYLLVAIGLFIEYGIFDVYNYLFSGKSSFIAQPNTLAIPAIAILGVVGLRYINDGYANSVVKLGIEEEYATIDDKDRKRFEGLVSFRIRVIAYIVTLVLYYAFVEAAISFSGLVEISGIGLVLYGQLVSYPLIIIPILVELTLSYVAIHVVVPRRLAQADFDLFFYDPRNLGGFEPVGQLLKRSYYIYTGILLLWFFQTHAPVILNEFLTSPYPPPGPIFQTILSGAWIVGVVSIGYSMYRVHKIMKVKKEERIQQLGEEIKNSLHDPYDAHPENIDDPDRYEKARETLAQVKNTKTLPTTFKMDSQIIISILLPQTLNMIVSLPG